jgi:hypothetical protein
MFTSLPLFRDHKEVELWLQLAMAASGTAFTDLPNLPKKAVYFQPTEAGEYKL